jgi:large subunit ribosomal protein L18
MTKVIDKKTRRKIRKTRSNMVKGTKERPRVVLSESNRYLRVQAIDDTVGNTLLFFSTEHLTENNDYSRKNITYARKLAEIFAEKLKKTGKEKIVFDRNGRPYHGKIGEFCKTMRELGISF